MYRETLLIVLLSQEGLEYHIVGMFGELLYQKYLAKNVWRMDRFGHKGIDLCKIWMVLVWRIISNLPSSPDFPLPDVPTIRYIN